PAYKDFRKAPVLLVRFSIEMPSVALTVVLTSSSVRVTTKPSSGVIATPLYCRPTTKPPISAALVGANLSHSNVSILNVYGVLKGTLPPFLFVLIQIVFGAPGGAISASTSLTP